MRCYRPDELFDESGALIGRSSRTLRRRGDRRMSANPHANGGLLLRDLELPDFRDYAVDVADAGHEVSEATRVLGTFLRDVMRAQPRDELPPVRPGRDRPRTGSTPSSRPPTAPGRPRSQPTDEHLAPDGRVMEVLSEHLCQGWLEGYLLTGRHGLFTCYEAFIHIVDSMFNQHAKWLKITREIPWRRPDRVAELPADLARLAAGPQRLLAPGPRLHRPRREQEGRGHPRLPAAGREPPAVGRRPLPAQPQLRQRHRRRASSRRSTTCRWTTRSLHCTPRRRHLGLGEQRRAASPTS